MYMKSGKDVLILGIESSCDETAASVVKNGREILSNVVLSQIDIHKVFGGGCSGNRQPQSRGSDRQGCSSSACGSRRNVE